VAEKHPSLEDFRSTPWQSAIEDAPNRECRHYCDAFCSRAAAAEAERDSRGREIYAFLARVTFPQLMLDEPAAPLGPSERLDVFSQSDLALIAELLPSVSDPEMQARMADILWLRNFGESGKRDYRMGQLAVTEYLASARALEDPQHWPQCVERTERALQIAAQLGKTAKNPLYGQVIAYIEEVIDRCNGEDPLFMSHRMMGLLQERGDGDPEKYGVLAEKAARRGEESDHWDRARQYWERAARWYQMAEDEERRRAAQIAAAETYIRDGEARISPEGTGYLVAGLLYQQGIEALRRVGGMQQRVSELHVTLLSYQEKSISEMGRFSEPITIDNIDEYVEHAQGLVRDQTLLEALVSLGLVCRSPSRSQIKASVKAATRQSPLSSIFGRTIVNERGRTQKRVAPSSREEEPEDASIETDMFSYAAQSRWLRIITQIEPARQQVILDQNMRMQDLAPLVLNNPFVPPGRERLFIRGLHAGLVGDFVVAAHLLIPQLDNAIRVLLEHRGIVVSGIDDDGTQPERGLNTTLLHPAAAEIFGEDTVFDLRGLLVEKAGTNLRHEVSHGLVDDRIFGSPQAAYTWWITLHLCVVALLSSNGANENETLQEEASPRE
jgi:Domain of unknown function (DUF4209)